jgi:hypothetical protein
LAHAVSSIIAGLLLLLASANANAGEKNCDSAVADVSPFYCQLERVDTVRLQLEGTARALGASRLDMERIMRERLELFLATLPDQPAGPAALLIDKRPQRGRLACTLWTVGEGLSVALFVECALQSTTTGDSVDARLLGRTTEAEFDMAARVALGRVVSKVTSRFNVQRDRLKVLSSKGGNTPIKTAGPAQ